MWPSRSWNGSRCWTCGASQGAHGINVAYATQDPFNAFTRLLRSDLHAPAGEAFGYYSDPEMDRLLAEAQSTFDPAARGDVCL